MPPTKKSGSLGASSQPRGRSPPEPGPVRFPPCAPATACPRQSGGCVQCLNSPPSSWLQPPPSSRVWRPAPVTPPSPPHRDGSPTGRGGGADEAGLPQPVNGAGGQCRTVGLREETVRCEQRPPPASFLRSPPPPSWPPGEPQPLTCPSLWVPRCGRTVGEPRWAALFWGCGQNRCSEVKTGEGRRCCPRGHTHVILRGGPQSPS